MSGADKFNAYVKTEIIDGEENLDDLLRYGVFEKLKCIDGECSQREGGWIEELNSIDEGGNWIGAGKKNNSDDF